MRINTRVRRLSIALLAGLLCAAFTPALSLRAAAAPAGAATATPVPAAAADAPAVTARANANIRSGPGTAYPVIGTMRAGQPLPVTGQAGGWWQVKLTSRTGWVWGGLVTANALARKAPAVTSRPPAPKAAAPTVTLAPHPTAPPALVVLGP